MNLKPEKYLRYLYLPNLFGTNRTKEILHVNPTVVATPGRSQRKLLPFVYDYNA